jgi:hypothetical protein
MGLLLIVAQGSSLCHSEFMLFIDDDQAETRKGNFIVQQSMRTHDQVDCPQGDSIEQFPTLASLDSAGQQFDVALAVGQTPRQAFGVLSR